MSSIVIKGIVKKGEYFDSISLMITVQKINKIEGVIDSAVVMGTRENKAILKRVGFLVDEFQSADDTDLLTLTSGSLAIAGAVTGVTTLVTSGNITVGGDLTVSGNELTFGNGEIISNEAVPLA